MKIKNKSHRCINIYIRSYKCQKCTEVKSKSKVHFISQKKQNQVFTFHLNNKMMLPIPGMTFK
jgi:NAD-dependent dihydropyrimidine dehydrogenase PreA subunit